MYWLFDSSKENDVRRQIIKLQNVIIHINNRCHDDQQFPFVGKKDQRIAAEIIQGLCNNEGIVCDPFVGSGTFAFAAKKSQRKIVCNEWEPYAFRMLSGSIRKLPSRTEINLGKIAIISAVETQMNIIYGTRCPCGQSIQFDALFFDRQPLRYVNPTIHERMGVNGENIIFRKKYRCPGCGRQAKKFDSFDKNQIKIINGLTCSFPNPNLIENARLNFTRPRFVHYKNLFSHRQQLAVMVLYDAINNLDLSVRDFFLDTFISILHLAKYTDYRSKSQDNHCPKLQNKETNLYHRFLEKVETRYQYLEQSDYQSGNIELHHQDFRDFLRSIDDSSIDLLFTDPPYGDSAQYFEHAQRIHPFLGYSLISDNDRLNREVVISNAPSRVNKHGKDQFLSDIRTLFKETARVLKIHSYFAMYFRPEQSDWIADLNKLKLFAREEGLEPLVSIPISKDDPSMRALESAAWTFKNDICLIFIKLKQEERRWYHNDIDVDELIYLASKDAAGPSGDSFSASSFFNQLVNQFRSHHISTLLCASNKPRIMQHLLRYADLIGSAYSIRSDSPYLLINSMMDAEQRIYELTPEVVDNLTAGGTGFTFEDFVLELASYMDNGSKKIIEELHTANSLVDNLLLEYAAPDTTGKKFYKLPPPTPIRPGAICLTAMSPNDFEILIGEFFKKRHYSNVTVVGKSGDRGIDIIATNSSGQKEFVQCKRWRGAKVGSRDIQRIDSMVRSRGAIKGWVITTSDFTKDGLDEARITKVTTMNGDDLLRSLDVYWPKKYSL